MEGRHKIYTKTKSMRLEPSLKEQIDMYCDNAEISFSEFSRSMWTSMLSERKQKRQIEELLEELRVGAE
jgi:hypothetical protein